MTDEQSKRALQLLEDARLLLKAYYGGHTPFMIEIQDFLESVDPKYWEKMRARTTGEAVVTVQGGQKTAQPSFEDLF